MLKKSIFLFGVIILLILFYLFAIPKISTNKPFFKDSKYQKEYLVSMISPSGEKPKSLSSLIQLSSKINQSQLHARKLKVVVCMHDLKNDWSEALLNGLKKTLHIIEKAQFKVVIL